ncbi:MAG: hypothetical protein ABJA76_11290 [Mucilaginibacter sp.]
MNDLASIPAFNLDWNPMTVEAYNEKKNEVTLVFNLDMTTSDKIRYVIQYVVGRTIWCCRNFPAKANIVLSFDIRGQNIIMSKTGSVKQRIFELIDNLNIDNKISIEFLR